MQIPKGGIAFFDSGIGGLTVLNACRRYFPNDVFYYYGDNKHAPYGNLPPKKIRRYVLKAFKTFERLNVRAVVLACNTATAVCVEELRKRYSFPIIGAEPAVCTAAMKGGRVLVLATRATCESERFRILCARVAKLFPDAEICIRACEGLAGAIERNLLRKDFDFSPYLPDERADAVVLGCTHYIYIVGQIATRYGCPIYDGKEGIARRLFTILNKKASKTDFLGNKNRKERPLEAFFDHKMSPLTTPTQKMGECQNFANECSQNLKKKNSKNEEIETLFFLGNQRENNENIYKQMFAF